MQGSCGIVETVLQGGCKSPCATPRSCIKPPSLAHRLRPCRLRLVSLLCSEVERQKRIEQEGFDRFAPASETNQRCGR